MQGIHPSSHLVLFQHSRNLADSQDTLLHGVFQDQSYLGHPQPVQREPRGQSLERVLLVAAQVAACVASIASGLMLQEGACSH